MRRALAGLLSGALIAAAAVVGVPAAANAAEAAAVTLPEVPREGATVAISGSGFDASGFGIYLSVRSNADSSDSFTVWIDDTNEVGELPGLGGTAPMTPEGSFTVDVPIPAYSEAGYTIVTRGAHGIPNPANNTSTPVVFLPAPAEATTTVLTSPAGSSAVDGTAIDLTATVSPAAAGSVTLSYGATTVGTAGVVGGVAGFSDVVLPVGVHTLTASFVPEDSAAFLPSAGELVFEVTAVEVPEEPVWVPAIEVFLADGVTPYTGQPVYTDDVLVVKGTGFDPEANVGGRGVPIPNTLPQGTYVVFGSFLDEWQPSSGAASSSRKAFGQKWVLAEAVLDQVPDRYQSAIRGQWAELSEDGSFEAELTVSDFESGLAGGNWGVYSYGAGGVANADQELSVAIDYRGERPVAPVFEPAIEVFLADGVTPYTGQPVSEGDQLVVKGTGFDPAANVGGSGVPIPSTLPQGTFIVFGSFADEWQPSTGAASSTRTINADSRVWALAEDVLEQVPPAFQSIIKSAWAPIAEDGSFTATVTLKAPTAPLADGNWGVYTYPGGVGAPANPEQELSVLVNFTASTPEEPEEPSGPKVTVTPDADLDPTVENTLTITGTGFTGPSAANGAYVLFGESSVWSGGSPLPGEGWLVQGWVMPREIVDGAFTTTLTIPANTLDPTKSYQVATSAAHGLSATDRTLDTFTPVTVGEPGTGGPAIGLSAPSVAQGSGLTVRGTGFPAGGKVTVTVGSTPIVLGSADADAEGAFEVSGVIPATFAPGAHTVTAVSGDVSVSLPLTVTAVVVVPTEPVPPAEPVCVAREVSGATFEWGVKASFRSYIEGSIAKGSYDIGWGYGSGSYNTDENRGRVGFGGSAHFTGHGGQLDLTISNPRVQIYSSGSAVLIANVSSKGYASNPGIDANGVALANLSLPAASVSGDTIAWYGASATLTEAGAAAFSGFYSAGDALDPVSFTFPLGGEVPCDATTSGELAATGGESESGAIWIGFVLIALGAALVVARRRAQHA